MVYFPMPAWEFFSVMNNIGVNTFEGQPDDGLYYNFYIPNTPSNSSNYVSWVVWMDTRTMPSWADIQPTGSAYARYQTAFYAVPPLRSESETAAQTLHTEVQAVPAQVQTDWTASSGLGVILHKPNLATVATSGSYTDLSNLPAAPAVASASHSIVTTTASTGFQISSTRLAFANYAVQIAATLSLTAGQSSTIYLETAATNSTTPSDWTTVTSVSNGNTGTLAIGLNLTQTFGAQLSGLIPAGKWVRIRSSGTATATFISGQEMMF